MNVANLTDREREILAMRVDYYSRKEIANRLEISMKTVNKHLQNVRTKFAARSCGEMLRWARLTGIVPAEKGAG